MGLKDVNPHVEEPKGLPEKTSTWSWAKLSEPRVAPVLERFTCDISVKRLTAGMIVTEFLAQRLATLQAHSRRLWGYRTGDEELRLWSQDFPTDELSRIVAILLGGNLGEFPEALGPLYRLDHRADMITRLPVFDEHGLFPTAGSGPVEVSSGDTSGEGDSEKTVEDCLTSAPLPSLVVLLRGLTDDDAASGGRHLAEDEEKKCGIKSKVAPDALPVLCNASSPADGEEEARKAISQALSVAPSSPRSALRRPW
ncbi:hypothetical protein D1007_27837 [Hordeum vulgare]|nr:hypothetical protein D1007_27837 [Hordeum vulgare]